ncbi:hypothetical protein EKH55_3855 [Sinorhizobium alkalisoli]|nr:hypothetical protein EKH55_3855 [Sinorhizobium alkalisoli]
MKRISSEVLSVNHARKLVHRPANHRITILSDCRQVETWPRRSRDIIKPSDDHVVRN